jgi:DNA-binding transcriptional LysR family regulator
VNLEFHLSSHRVDLIRERFDAAFRVEVDDNHDQLFVMRQLGRMERILVAAPALMHQLPPVTIEALATSPILSMGEHVERDRWALIHTDGRQHVVTLHPQLVSNDSVVIREAAVDGLGIALLPVLTCAAEIARGGLVQVLPEWHAPEGSIHLIFTAKKGMSNTLRAFIDHVVGAFSNSVRQVRA